MADEKRLIDANKASDVNALFELYMKPENESLSFEEAMSLWIGLQSTVDAVEVVRCRNCKHRYYNEYNEAYCCEVWADGFDTAVSENEFCSRGERKDNG